MLACRLIVLSISAAVGGAGAIAQTTPAAPESVKPESANKISPATPKTAAPKAKAKPDGLSAGEAQSKAANEAQAKAEGKVEGGAANKADKNAGEQAGNKGVAREGTMTIARMDTIIRRLDKTVLAPRPGFWKFKVRRRTVIVATDLKHNRMRILSPISKVKGVSAKLLKRLMQANFDTALDARYAIARGIIWGTFIHPLSTLHDRQFISAIGQTVNLALTFGTTFSSGATSYDGGDSGAIIRKQLIESLMKKGLPI